jgi:ribosomal protein S18 acetylase RimI-like enzyme
VIASPTAEELDAVVALIAGEQARPERNVTYLGVEPDGIRAELDDLEPPWTQTVRVLRRAPGETIAGATLADWDAELGRAWIHGPWVAGDDAAWGRWARPLLDAALDQLPAGVQDIEISGDLANRRMGALADELDWTPTEANYAYVLSGDAVATWEPSAHATRPLGPTDVDAIRPLHDAEFPATYLPVERLLEEALAGDRTALVAADADGRLLGYATGRVQADGEGYIDFVAVDPAARGTGAGRALVQALSEPLLAASSTGRVNLTVQEHRTPARALYARLGFRVDAAFRGYRSRPG